MTRDVGTTVDGSFQQPVKENDMSHHKILKDRKKLRAVCGLFCPSCTVFIGTTEDPERLKGIAERFGWPVEAWKCEGCRSEKRSYYCENLCHMAACAAGKGLEFCGEWGDYPCEELKKFQAERPHRIELWESQKWIAQVVYSRWFDEMVEHFRVPGVILLIQPMI
jgi:hypothetical protein